MKQSISRRGFLRGITAGSTLLAFNYALAGTAVAKEPVVYRRFEDVYRNKWTWDKVARGSHGTNCAGNCAFNVYVRNGVVWREEQQGAYEPSGDSPDYGPRGCQKGLRHAKYMYGKQRVLYPMKRVGERGEGKWERISWAQATAEIADKFIDYATQDGPEVISLGSGTQLGVKLGSLAALYRFANITGVMVPEFYSGVGDLPTGVYMTLGEVYVGDTMASIYHSKCCLVWMSNPAVTRIPDAHFFWEARYNGTEVIAISPEFTPTAMHSDKWLNPKPGTDTALALAMLHVILEEGDYAADYIKEQTDLPFLVRLDTKEFLRASDLSLVDKLAVNDDIFYLWDEDTQQAVMAPGTGKADKPLGRDRRKHGTLVLGEIQPALEGRWQVDTLDGTVEVTTVFELVKQRAAEHAPEKVAELTGLNPSSIREVAKKFAAAKPAMIYSGYAACKWLHGDMLQRAFLLLLACTGNIGQVGGGLQISNSPKARGFMTYALADVGPALRVVSGTTWDYDQGKMKELTAKLYGQELADEYHARYEFSRDEGWFPDYGRKAWKMGFFAGNNGANWRASGNRWRETAFGQLECIVTLTPDASVTSHYSDYVLPIAHHYERTDIVMQARTPYAQVLDAAVPPLGESVDDWEAFRRIAEAIERRAKERGISAFRDNVDGRTVRRDLARCHQIYTMEGRVKDTRDVVQFIINTTPGIPKMSFQELAQKGIVRVQGSDSPNWEDASAPYHSEIYDSVKHKIPYETVTGRQQFYIDHEWFIEYDEQLPGHRDPLMLEGYPLQMMMGHARHGIHSTWRDDSFLLSLQRGEPDIYVNPDDAKARKVVDGDLIRVFNGAGEFYAQAHVSSVMQPGMVFMYHGWDPMMFKGRQNFAAVVSTAGLIKPTSMAGDWGHLGYQMLRFAPNQTYKDFSVNFELAESRVLQELQA